MSVGMDFALSGNLHHLADHDDLRGRMGKCLLALLNELGWDGEERSVLETLPHFSSGLTVDDFRAALMRLGFDTRRLKRSERSLIDSCLPAISLDSTKELSIVFGGEEGRLRVYDGDQIRTVEKADVGSDIFIIENQAEVSADASSRLSWTGSLLLKFKRLIPIMLISSFLTNLLALAMPIFIMITYDKIVPSGSTTSLVWMAAGVLIAFLGEAWFRTARARIQAWLGARIDMEIGVGIFQKLVMLPPAMIEQAQVSQQITQIKQFESLRDFFSGPFISIIFDIPFLIVFIVVIAILGGSLAFITVALVVCFVFIGAIMLIPLRLSMAELGRRRAERQEFFVEACEKHLAIQQFGAENIWLNRYRDISARAAKAHYRVNLNTGGLQAIANLIMTLAGVAMLASGAGKVIGGTLSMGELIAVMALTWRVLSPLKSAFLSLSRLEQIQCAVKQLDRLMQANTNTNVVSKKDIGAGLSADLHIEAVNHRFRQGGLVLRNISLAINAREFIAITGDNGRGKSTLLKIMAGFIQPSTGRVLMGQTDLRQIDDINLRKHIVYLPQNPCLFHGTLRQNIQLAEPGAHDDEIIQALDKAGIVLDARFPEGLDTRLNDSWQKAASEGLIQQVCLARCWIQRAKIILLDEPATNIDHEADRCLIATLKALKGSKTVIMTTHRPSHMKLADRLVVMDKGSVTNIGRPSDVMD